MEALVQQLQLEGYSEAPALLPQLECLEDPPAVCSGARPQEECLAPRPQPQPRQVCNVELGVSSEHFSSGGLFGAAAVSPVKAGGLFGAQAPATPQVLAYPTSTLSLPAPSLIPPSLLQASGGLFGTPSSAPSPGGLFSTPQQPQTPGGIFGGPVQGDQKPGGLFGAAPGASGGLFSTPAPVAQGGLFGSPAPAAAGGLFGAPSQGGGGLFGKQSALCILSSVCNVQCLFAGKAAEAVKEVDPSCLWTSLDQLSLEEREAFQGETFSLGRVPVRPPPRELCV